MFLSYDFLLHKFIYTTECLIINKLIKCEAYISHCNYLTINSKIKIIKQLFLSDYHSNHFLPPATRIIS